MVALLLGGWLQMADLLADDTAGGKAACYARCDADWGAGAFYCLFLIEEVLECWENNSNGRVACKKSCDALFPDYPE